MALTWLEPDGSTTGDGYRLRFTTHGPAGWSEPVTVVEGRPFFANWADRPGVASRGDGGLVAHWLEKTAPDTYAYSIGLAGSDDGGATWYPLGTLNDDDTDTEHGFVSWVPEGTGARAFWLDGRATANGGPMTLRTALVDRAAEASELLDDSVCDCCSTAATTLAGESVVAYRDRTVGEVRDIFALRGSAAGWGAPERVHDDGWRIEGCPVNGPSVAALGDDLAVIWFSAADGTPRVQLAFASGDGSFTDPILLDGAGPLGRTDLVDDGRGGLLASWLGRGEGESGTRTVRIRLARVAPDGSVGPVTDVGEAAAGRSSGVPRLAVSAGYLYLAWVGAAEDGASELRLRRIPLDEVSGSTVGS